MRKPVRLVSFGLFMALLLLFAAPATAAPPSQASDTGPDLVGALVASPPTYYESFRKDFGDWETNDEVDFQTYFATGAYHIRVDAEETLVWAASSWDIANFYAEVDAFYVAGPEDNSFGISFRQQDNGDMYIYSASTDGYFRLVKLEGGEFISIVDWTQTAVVETGPDAVNRIAVLADGASITLFINDQVVDEVEDTSFTSGWLGLSASAPGEGGIEVAFDDMRVWDLDAMPEEPVVVTTLVPTEEPAPTETPEVVVTPEPVTVDVSARLEEVRSEPLEFSDDFRSDNGRWGLSESDSAVVSVANRTLQIEVFEANWMNWSVNDGANPANFLIEADVTRVEGDPNTEYGILFRLQDGDNFYFFPIDGLGNYSLYKKQNGEWTALIPWTASEEIDIEDGAINRMAVLAEDTLLTLLINDSAVAQIEDETFASGRLALAAGTFDQAPLTAQFDNVDIWILVEGETPERPTAESLAPPDPDAMDQVAALHDTDPDQSDQFLRATGRWPIEPTESSTFSISRALRIEVTEPQLLAWTINQDVSPADFLVEVDGWVDEAQTEGEYGIIIRRQDADNYYLYAISGDGFFGFWKRVGGEWETVIPWSNTDAIDPEPGAINRPGVLAIGNRITLMLNDTPLTTLVDDTFATGDIGLVAGSFDATPVNVGFDDFALWDLTE